MADATVLRLCSLGLIAEACYSAAECLQRVAGFRPNIVFLDEVMEIICDEIRERCKPDEVHIVGLTNQPFDLN